MKLADLIKRWSNEGIRFPLAYSHDEEKPSVTLFFVYVTGILALGSTFSLNFTETTLTAAGVAISFWCLAMVWYRMRRLDKFKIDFDDRSIELDAGDDDDRKS